MCLSTALSFDPDITTHPGVYQMAIAVKLACSKHACARELFQRYDEALPEVTMSIAAS